MGEGVTKNEKQFRAAVIDLSHCREKLTPLSRLTPNQLRDNMREAWSKMGPKQRKAAEPWLEAMQCVPWVKFLLRGVDGLWSDDADEMTPAEPEDDDEP